MTDYSGYMEITPSSEELKKFLSEENLYEEEGKSKILEENSISDTNKQLYVEAVKNAKYILYELNKSNKFYTVENGGAACVVTTAFGNLKIVCKAIMPPKTEKGNIPIVVSEEVTFRITGSLLISEGKKIKTKKLLKAINFINKMYMWGNEEKIENPLFYGSNTCVEFMFNTNADLGKYDCTQIVAYHIEKAIQKLLLILAFSCKPTKKNISMDEEPTEIMNNILEILPRVYNSCTRIINENVGYLFRFECSSEMEPIDYEEDIYLNAIIDNEKDYYRMEIWTYLHGVNSYEKVKKLQEIIDLMNDTFCKRRRFSIDLKFKNKKTIIKIVSQMGLSANKKSFISDITLYIMILKNLFLID